ncbi:hypothetical protein ACN9MZ_19695 [Pseudoduganella sp. S-14]|jgi:hypothetical protein|uniref:hypothetical protein n=1 Tax=Pseudoduganella sp. S-14 TaxID=3404065 RepID=UPI003CF38F5C
MILLPDEDELSVGAQVHAVIGDALRLSVADAEPSAGFAARLAAALDEVERDSHLVQTQAMAGEPACQDAVPGEDKQAGEAGRGAGHGSEAAEAAS